MYGLHLAKPIVDVIYLWLFVRYTRIENTQSNFYAKSKFDIACMCRSQYNNF